MDRIRQLGDRRVQNARVQRLLIWSLATVFGVGVAIEVAVFAVAVIPPVVFLDLFFLRTTNDRTCSERGYDNNQRFIKTIAFDRQGRGSGALAATF